jgi:hypothetical protein
MPEKGNTAAAMRVWHASRSELFNEPLPKAITAGFRQRNITHIDEKGLWVDPSARKTRPDRSTLIVYDHDDAEVLNVKPLNASTISFTGIFRVKGRPPVAVADESIPDMRLNATFTGQCMQNVEGGFDLN